MGHNFVILSVLQEEPLTQLPLLLRCGELELQGLHPPNVVDAQHALLHFPGHSGNGGVCRVDLWGETHLVATPKLLLGVSQLGLPEHGIEVRQCDLGPILLHLTVVKPHCGPCSADPCCHQQGLVSQA